MRVWPAVDLLGGEVVQLKGGDPGDRWLSRPDPIAVARNWIEQGFDRLHVIDLDAALGRGSNRDLVSRLRRAVEVPLQVGGGIRDDETLGKLVKEGVDRLVLGSRAVTEPTWALRMAERYPGRIVVAIEVRAGRILTQGWTEEAACSPEEILASFDGAPIAGFLCTSVDREGQLQGADLSWAKGLRSRTEAPLCITGGISSLDDLRALARIGIEEVVLGTALYLGRIDSRAILKEFGSCSK